MTLLHGENAPALRDLFAADQKNTLRLFDDPSWDSIPPIWSGGATFHPRLALVFVNPTYRNQAARMGWPDPYRAPHIGARRMWRFLAGCGLASWDTVMGLPHDMNWGYDDAALAYQDAADHGVYITNLVKACRTTSKMPTTTYARTWLPLLQDELTLIKPSYVIAMGTLTSSLLIGKQIKVGEAYRYLETGSPYMKRDPVTWRFIIPSYFPAGRGDPQKAQQIITAAAEMAAALPG